MLELFSPGDRECLPCLGRDHHVRLMHTAHYILHRAVSSEQCAVCYVQYTVCMVRRTVCSLQCGLCSMQFAVGINVQFAVFIVCT